MDTPIAQYKAGQVIPNGPGGDSLPFIVQSGCVASYIHTARGDRVFDALYPAATGFLPLTPMEMHGYTPNSHEAAYKSFMALTDCSIIQNIYPIRTQVATQACYSGFFFGQLRALDAWRGVLFLLLEFGKVSPDGKVSISLLQSLIGDVIGYTRESVSNAIGHLKSLGLVETHKPGRRREDEDVSSMPTITLLNAKRAYEIVFGDENRD